MDYKRNKEIGKLINIFKNFAKKMTKAMRRFLFHFCKTLVEKVNHVI